MGDVKIPLVVVSECERRLRKSGECIVWTGGNSHIGQPEAEGSRSIRRHQMLEDPDDRRLHVRCICGTPMCINPEHLRVTIRSRTGVNKNAGERGFSKALTPKQEIEAERMLDEGQSQGKVAAAFGVSQPTIHRLYNRMRYRRSKEVRDD